MFPNVFILLIQPGDCRIDDSDRMLSFTASHALGVEMLKGMLLKILFFGWMLLYSLFVCVYSFLFPGLGCLFLASLDAELVPENLFRICLEHEQMFTSSHKSPFRYNFYKVWIH